MHYSLLLWLSVVATGTLHGRLFDGKPIETLVFSSSGMTIEDGSYHQISKSTEEEAGKDEGEPAEDVDDFLNSLLWCFCN